MDVSSLEGRILMALNRRLREKGIRYKDVATKLGVSESTVKRYFSKNKLSLSTFCELVDIAGIDLEDLSELVEDVDRSERNFTYYQRLELARDPVASFIFLLFSQGWTANQIVQEFDLADQIDGAVDRLQSAGLVRRLSGRIKVLVLPNRHRPSDRITEFGRQRLVSIFKEEVDLEDPACEWQATTVRLSLGSMERLQELIDSLLVEADGLSKSDIGRGADKVRWYRLFAVAQPTDRRKLLR